MEARLISSRGRSGRATKPPRAVKAVSLPARLRRDIDGGAVDKNVDKDLVVARMAEAARAAVAVVAAAAGIVTAAAAAASVAGR